MERLLAFDERAGAVRDHPEFLADPLHTENIILSVSPPLIFTCSAATKSGLDASPGEIMDKLRTLKNNFKG